jgi:multicomponent Na+:H+ antiporter subunit G
MTLATLASPVTAPPATVLAAASEAPTVGPVRGAAVAALVAVGTFFLFVGTIGLLRLPNVYNRLHATTKATTLGAASIFLAGFVYFGPEGRGLTSLVGIVFLFLTAPTGSHLISRAAEKMGVAFLDDEATAAAPLDELEYSEPAEESED